jgi:NADPH-dependent 2,4-dienoyl-CoA reductase/sulfur reductase-like enzyme/rhodanese-related sulfurtransferase
MPSSNHPSKRVVIVGGNAGGIACATRLRRLDEQASILVFERGKDVSYATCGLPYYVGGVISDRAHMLVASLAWLRQVFAIQVYTEHLVERVDRSRKTITVRNLREDQVREEPYDALVLAPGSRAVIPSIEGIDSPRVFTLRSLEDADRLRSFLQDSAPQHATIIGGGYIGIEVCENFLRLGLRVCVVEKLPQVLPQLDSEMVTPLHEELKRRKVDLHLGTEVQSMGPGSSGGLKLLLSDENCLETDFVLVAAGVRPNSELAAACGLQIGPSGGICVNESMQTNDPNIWAVGDAAEVKHWITGRPLVAPLAGPTARQARVAAESICGRPSRYRGVQGTNIVAFFGLTFASTGASEKQLREAGIPYMKSYSNSPHHATYYPGAERMTTKLLWHPETGMILGAQIVGGQGVDRRIDLLSMAIQQRATVFDLEEAEMAYAPQFGSTRDPVNIAGSVAANILRRDAEAAYWEEWIGREASERPLLVDVRNPGEYVAGAVENSINIPLPELRQRLQELSPAQEVWVYCGVGQRGYYASRILAQHGYRVRNVSGGMTTYRMINR